MCGRIIKSLQSVAVLGVLVVVSSSALCGDETGKANDSADDQEKIERQERIRYLRMQLRGKDPYGFGNFDPHTRTDAAIRLGKMGIDTDLVVTILLEALQEKEEYYRYVTAFALGEMGKSAKAAIPTLEKLSKDTSTRVGRCALFALTMLEPTESRIDAVAKFLGNPDRNTRSEAFRTLHYLGSAASQAAPAFLKAIKDNDQGVPDSMVITGLIKMGHPVIPVLVRGLKYKSAIIRTSAATSLGFIDPPVQNAIPALIQALEDKNDNVRREAAFALMKIGGDSKVLGKPLIKAS